MAKEEFKHIVRLAGMDLKGEKPVRLALADLKGVSRSMARAIAHTTDVDVSAKIGSLKDEYIKRLDEALRDPGAHGIPSWMLNRRRDLETGEDKHLVGGEIEMALRSDIGRERHVRSYRGIRHELGLPVRGQRTKSTGRTGMTVGVKRKKIRIREEAEKGRRK
ncbi:MAG: 30S ribosomal protein S13 [Candidatus Hadarchaeota archaeon]|nr:30S ribosomal protein S13 [Candidatus Hadarchaeota archaeon]